MITDLVTGIVPQALVMVYTMVSVPETRPLTTPAADTVARVVFVLLQLPPAVASVNVVEAPGQTELLPEIAATNGDAISNGKRETNVPQLLVTVYLSVSIPEFTPVTTPPEVIVAIEVYMLLQVPPVAAVVSVVVPPVQMLEVPPSVTGALIFTVTTRNTEPVKPQLFVTEYLMVSVPADMAVTNPVLLIVATEVFALDQVPPAVPSVSARVLPTHTADEEPEIAAGAGVPVMVILRAVVTVPQALVSV